MNIKPILEGILHGEFSVSEAIDLLRNYLQIDLDDSIRKINVIHPLNCEVEITPIEVQNVLNKYIRGEVDADYLTKWAFLLTTLDEFTTPPNDDEDYYEHMWYVLQQLSSPEIDGKITLDKISGHVIELDGKYS